LEKHIQRLILPLMLMILATQLVADPAIATGVYQMPCQQAMLTARAKASGTWVIDQAEVLTLQ